MTDAFYLSSVSLALPGLALHPSIAPPLQYSALEWFILFWLPQERGWAYIHHRATDQGYPMQWPVPDSDQAAQAEHLAAKYAKRI